MARSSSDTRFRKRSRLEHTVQQFQEIKLPGESITYYFETSDYGENVVTTEEYTVEVKPGIGIGYFEDFEGAPSGWYSFGANDTWEMGVPTSGPNGAASGENVYATNLAGNYLSQYECNTCHACNRFTRRKCILDVQELA